MACFANATRHRVGVQSGIRNAKRFSGHEKAQKGQNTNREYSAPYVFLRSHRSKTTDPVLAGQPS
jgi:hypothetical protein